MPQYLLAAEADQIQDFIFHAAHLREVVGGSQILIRFGDRVKGAPPALKIPDNDVIVSGGGSLRILVNDLNQAIKSGEQLAEIYRLATDGSLTVIDEPVEVKSEADFANASKTAQERLRSVKRQRHGRLTTAHLPHIAFCVSCGIGLAAWYKKRHSRSAREQFLCEACRLKGDERAEESLGEFLEPFVQAVIGEKEKPEEYIWPGKMKDRLNITQEIDPASDLGQLDPRRYVAYLVADGNSMGRVFDLCDQHQMRKLSIAMTETLRACLAETTNKLRSKQNQEIAKIDPNFIPALPLILGGDDLFAILPAPWALDFARHFCTEFEEQMTSLVNGLKLAKRAELPKRITLAAGVVICKANYPFYLAHEIGKKRLEHAKQLTKRLAKAQSNNQMFSIVDFEIILGSQAGIKPDQGKYRATLRPYWAGKESPPPGWGLTLEELLEQRQRLHLLPNKRLSQLRELYYPSNLPEKKDDEERWRKQREALLKRIGRDEEMKKQVDKAVDALGGQDWYASKRVADDDWYGHGLPDLLEAWDFAYKLEVPRREYEGGV